MTKPLRELTVTQSFGARQEYYKQFGLAGHAGADFRTKGLGNGFFNNLMGYQPCYAVEDGELKILYGNKGYGNHIYLTGDSGTFLYAHLKNARGYTGQKVLEGDIIGITGASGNAQGAHLHFGWRPNNFDIKNGYFGYVDPMSLFEEKENPLKLPLEIAFIGDSLPILADFAAEVAYYSNNRFPFVTSDLYAKFDVSSGMLTQDQAYQAVDRINPKQKFIFLFYEPNLTSAFYATYWYPKKRCTITTCPGTDARLLTFELGHAVQIMFNENRGKNFPVPIADSNFPSDEMIRVKFDSVAKYYK